MFYNKIKAFGLVSFFSPVFLGACGGDNKPKMTSIPPTIEIESGIEVLFEENLRIPMRDGTSLSANVFRPTKDGPYPVLMAMTPYNKDDLPVEYEAIQGNIQVSDYASFETLDPGYWVPQGYAVVTIDTRGSNLSEGNLSLLSQQEAQDYYDAIEWFSKRPWSNGKVGLAGVSYMALNQWQVASLAPPSLAAIMPWEGFTDVYRDLAYHGGIPNRAFLDGWWQFRILDNKNQSSNDPALPERVRENPLLNEFYQNLGAQNLSSVRIPAYITASWPDHGLHTRGTLLGYEGISSEHKWLEIHGRKKWEWFYSLASQARQQQFFDYFLKGSNNGMLEVPRVQYELRSAYYEGETKTSDTWPLENTLEQQLYLDFNSLELQQAPVNTASEDFYYITGDENFQGDKQSVKLKYTFNHDTEITGSMSLNLWISIQGNTDTDLFIGIQKENENNEQIHIYGNDIEKGQVANGWLRASHRELDTELSLPTRPWHKHQKQLAIDENEVIPVNIEIHPSSTLFRAGEQLVIIIQGSDIEESGIYHDSIKGGRVTLYSDPDHPSQLVYNSVIPN
ncbi:CocE/NonD family hydrolase [Agaribacterium sp. ZY112]|uniref:CocE/NonD family hydrolase n=1 Tax=Agaribacterium sp. ZY112 TaxID=3233574 RepID=UPI0035240B0D